MEYTAEDLIDNMIMSGRFYEPEYKHIIENPHLINLDECESWYLSKHDSFKDDLDEYHGDEEYLRGI